MPGANLGVNLPRWGLKRLVEPALRKWNKCKFTPLGFETLFYFFLFIVFHLCKFTPLGFETIKTSLKRIVLICVNLPRWGLKLCILVYFHNIIKARVNLPRWGLKRLVA